MALLQEFRHRRACGMQAGQNGENRLLAFLNLLVQRLVGLVERGETRRAVDDSNGVDIVELLFAVVDG